MLTRAVLFVGVQPLTWRNLAGRGGASRQRPTPGMCFHQAAKKITVDLELLNLGPCDLVACVGGLASATSCESRSPAGWIRVESRSKPGSFYYAHPATKRTQLERPVDPRYAQREKPKAVVEPQPAPVQDPVTVDDDVETLEEKQKREEERKAEQKAREEAEEKEREEVLLRARQRRAQQMLEEEKRRKEEEEQEEEERQRAAERRREKKAEAERVRKEMEEKEEKEAKEAPKPVAAASAALGRRDAAKEAQGKRRKKADSDEDADSGEEEITLEELEKWKASEEQHEREEAEAKRRKIEEEERRKAEAELAEKRKKAEFEEAVARARRMKSESSFHKQEELRRGPNANGQEPEPAKAEPTKAASSASAEAELAKAEPTKMAVPPPQALTQTQPPQIFPPPPQIQPSAQFPFQFPAMQAQVPRPPSPPPPPPPTPPTLANLLSGAVAKPDFGKLLKQPKPPVEEDPATGPQTGTVLWYNGRRKSGMILADRDSRRLRIPSHAATMGGVAPPVPAGLMHGTRVNFMLDTSAPGDPMCVQVRPLPNQVGLSCGGDSQAGQKLVNEDRTIATDLQDPESLSRPCPAPVPLLNRCQPPGELGSHGRDLRWPQRNLLRGLPLTGASELQSLGDLWVQYRMPLLRR